MKGIFERKRILSLLLTLVMLMSLLPGFTFTASAADTVAVSVAYIDTSMLNIATYKNNAVRAYLESHFNHGQHFSRVYLNNLSIGTPRYMKYSNTYEKSNNDSLWKAEYAWSPQSGSAFSSLVSQGEISYELQGQLKCDVHTNFIHHWKKKRDSATLTMYQNGTKRTQFMNRGDDREKTWYTYGDNQWHKAYNSNFKVELYHTACGCGSSGVRRVIVAFADLVSPKIKSVTTTANKKYYNSGSFDIEITFSENIRFADGKTAGKVAGPDNELVLNAFNRQTGQQINGVTAKLVSLNGNKLTYRYTVPEDNTTDIIIKGVADASRQTMFGTARDLYMHTKNGYEHLSVVNDIYAPFCDLAGNPVDTEWKPVSFPAEIYVDKVAPKYSHTEISGSMMKDTPTTESPDRWPADIDRSQVFAGVGDTLTFDVYFNEELSCGYSDDMEFVTATLNVKDKDGNPVVLEGDYAQTVKTSVNSYVPVTRIQFHSLIVEEGMIPEDDARGVTITDIDIGGLTDLCSNPFTEDAFSALPAAKQQEWLDTVPPTVKTAYLPDALTGKYTPGIIEKGFCFPVQIIDQSYPEGTVTDANLYMSGTNALGDGTQAQESGVFILSNNSEPYSGVEYEWCITMSPDLTGEETWNKGVLGGYNKFTQIENGNYIYIRLMGNEIKPLLDPVLTVYGYDYAGNVSRNSEFPIDIPMVEKVAPSIESVFGTYYEGDTKYVSVQTEVKDEGGLNGVKYKVLLNSTDESTDNSSPMSADDFGSEWIQTAERYGVVSERVDLKVALKLQKNNFVYVCVSATDRCGNTTEELFAYNVDMRLPSYDVNVPGGYVGDAEDVYIGKLNKEEAAEIGWRWEVNKDTGEAYKSYGSLLAVVKAGDQIAAKFVDDLTDEAPQDTNSENKPVSKLPSDEDIDKILSSLDIDSDGFVKTDENGNTAFSGAMVYDEYGINLETGEVISTEDGTAEFTVSDLVAGTNKVNELSDFASYYGEIEIYTVFIDAKEYGTDGSIVIKQASEDAESGLEGGNSLKPVSVQKYVLKAAVDDGSNNPIHTATFGKLRTATGETFADDDYRFDPEASFETLSGYVGLRDENGDPVCDDKGNYVYDYVKTKFATLSGMQLPVTLENNRIYQWGVEDIDFENSYFEVYRDTEDNVAFKQPMAAGSSAQTVVFPDDIVYETGDYYIKAHLTAKASGRVDEFVYDKCLCVLNFEPESFGDILKVKNDHGATVIDNTGNGIPITQVYNHIPSVDEPQSYTTLCYYDENATDLDTMNVFIWNDDRNGRMRFILSDEEDCVLMNVFGMWDAHDGDGDGYLQVGFLWYDELIKQEEPITETVYYQAVYANGKTSPVKQMDVILTPMNFPEISCSAVPGELSGTMQILVDDITFHYGEMQSLFVVPDFADTYNIIYDEENWITTNASNSIDFENMVLTDQSDTTYDDIEYPMYYAKILEDNTLAIDFGDGNGYVNVLDTEELAGHTYTLFAVDSTGAVGHSEPIDTGKYFDNKAPIVTKDEVSAQDGAYEVTLSLSDHELASGENMRLYISPEAPAADGDESEETENTDVVLIKWSELSDNHFGSLPNSAGIYSMEVTEQNELMNAVTVTFSGSVPQSGALYVYAIDELGYESTPINLFDGIGVNPATEPEITDIARADDGTLKLTFNEAVRVSEPASEEVLDNIMFEKEVSGIPIYSDGKHTVRYEDIFGNEYVTEIVVALDGDFNLKTEISPLDATNGTVTLSTKSARDDDLLKITAVNVTAADGTALSNGTDYESELSEDKQSLSVIMKVNGSVTVTLSYGGETQQRTFAVNNIDKETHAAIMWEYDAGEPSEGDTETAGSVTAICYSTDETEELTGLNGILSYTFESGNAGDSYTFEFTDEAGNTGTIDAVLPVTINRPVPPRLNGFDMLVSGVINSKTQVLDEYSYFADEEETEEICDFSTLLPAQSDVLTFSTGVDAKVLVLPAGTTKESVTNDTVSAEIPGVSLSGKKLTITENAEFTVALLEAESVASAAGDTEQKVIIIPVKIENIQKIENVELVYAVLSRFKRRVYFEPNGQNLTLTNTEGIELETEHDQYWNYWYHDFSENGQFIFYFKDDVGNSGSITATVNDIIDMNVGTAEGIRWWPYDGDDQSTLTKNKVNYDVTAQMKFNMNITEASLYYADASGTPDMDKPVPEDVAALNVTLNRADVTFKSNAAKTVLVVTGENGTEMYQQIQEVNVIDKQVPVISHNYTANNNSPRKSVTVAFTADKEVLYTERSSAYTTGPINVTITENGSYTYSFTDRAGNTTVVTFDVTDIDATPATVSYKLTEEGTEYATWQELAENNDVSNISEVYVKADEAISYTFQNLISGTAEANSWFKLDIVKNGYYPLHVWDKARNYTIAGLSGILVPDTTSPSLWLSPLRISVAQGIDDASLAEALKQGVTISDDVTKTEEIELAWDLSAFDVNTPGEYSVIYTAKDKAGNETKAERFVLVVGENEATLRVNGKDTTYMGTVIIDSADLEFEVGNLANYEGVYEPYSLYIKKGYKTAGQMKNDSTKVTDNKITVTDSGIYTVYIMTQSRNQYITYLYIEQ